MSEWQARRVPHTVLKKMRQLRAWQPGGQQLWALLVWRIHWDLRAENVFRPRPLTYLVSTETNLSCYKARSMNAWWCVIQAVKIPVCIWWFVAARCVEKKILIMVWDKLAKITLEVKCGNYRTISKVSRINIYDKGNMCPIHIRTKQWRFRSTLTLSAPTMNCASVRSTSSPAM